MAYCSECGSALVDGARFCHNCGSSSVSVRTEEAQGVLGVIRHFARSPLFLAAVIAYTLYVVFQLISAMFVPQMMADGVRMAAEYAESAEMYEVLEFLDMLALELDMQGTTISNLLSAISGAAPMICVAIGLWMFLVSARIRGGSRLSTSGITLTHIVFVIQMVMTIAGFAFLLLGILIFAIVLILTDPVPYLWIVFAVLFAVIGIAAVINFLYYYKLCKTLQTLKNILRTGEQTAYASQYVGVIILMSAALNLLTVFFAGGWGGTLSVLCFCTANICFGVLLFQYRSRVRMLPNVSTVSNAAVWSEENDFSVPDISHQRFSSFSNTSNS